VEGHLERWSIGEDLLRHLMAGGDPDGWVRLRAAHGGVPPGALGRAFLAGFIEDVEELYALAGRPVTSTAVAASGGGELMANLPLSVELDVDSAALGTRRVRLVGNLTHLAGTHVDVSYSRDHPSVVLRAGIGLLAAIAQGARTDGATVVGARVVRRAASDRDPVGSRELRLRGEDTEQRAKIARDALARLVDLTLRVRTGAVPLLRRSAWSITAETDVTQPLRAPLSTDVERDLSDLATQVVLGVSTLAEFADQVDGPLEEGLPEAATPVQRWSVALQGAFADAFGAGSAADDASVADAHGDARHAEGQR